MHIAIIGTGISGSLLARLLATRHDVTIFEANGYAGGHANTVDINIEGSKFPVDTGFMVYNRRNYPNFCRLLELLEIASRPSDMSFSVCCSHTGVEYQGSSLNGLFAQRRNALRPSFWTMLKDIARFNRLGLAATASGELRDGRPVGAFLQQCRLGKTFVDRYLVPMAAAIWSATPSAILDFPAEFMIGFFANHGLLQLHDRPRWRTIMGGSRRYVRALLQPLQEKIRLNCPVAEVTRTANDVEVKPVDGPPEYFDQVVFAAHADQALKMLSDATLFERKILNAFPYQANEAVLHTDTRLLPRRRRAWASWNYYVPRGTSRSASVTYDLSRLQGHRTSTPILLTLNKTTSIDPRKILRTFTYHHPSYSRESILAQQQHDQVSGYRKTHFCGAYWGYGFHEDGVNSALAVARHFGIGLEACAAASTKEPSGIVAAYQ